MEREIFHHQEGECDQTSIKTEAGNIFPTYIPTARNKPEFQNQFCQFKPAMWVEINDIWYPITYKVVTQENHSLGLRKNPNIINFPMDQWCNLDDQQTQPGKTDWGGVWSALKLSGAKTLLQYMQDQYQIKTNIYLAAIAIPLYANSYRIKSKGIRLLKQI